MVNFYRSIFLEDISPFRKGIDTCFELLVRSGLAMVDTFACNEYLRVITDMTPADLLMISMAAEPFWPTHLYTYKHWAET